MREGNFGGEEKNRVIAVGIKLPRDRKWEIEESMEELKELIDTAGGDVIISLIKRRDRYDPATILGRGALEELRSLVKENNVDLVVFDMDPKPVQVRNLEDFLGVRVIGRTDVILDIFAQRARTSEAKAQVELAQLKFLLPRIIGYGKAMSRLGGGIGTRGPGEKELEYDRRHIQRRINVLEKKLKDIETHRRITRKRRKRVITGAIVGYTNAGKSTLLNALAKSELFVEDRLFATLDSYSREVFLRDGKKVVLSDTVGFIRRLPPQLVKAFRSTLEEVVEADFLLHVVDISSTNPEERIEVVNGVLKELGAYDKPTIMVFNKIDKLKDVEAKSGILKGYNGVFVSAKKKIGLDELKKKILGVMDILNKV